MIRKEVVLRLEHMELKNVMGNPRVTQLYPYTYLWKLIPIAMGMGMVYIYL